MKRCPTCGNTYTNDELLFCLEDGAKLVRLSDSKQSFEPEPTLRVSYEDILPAPADYKAAGAPTVRQQAPAPTDPSHRPVSTSDNQPPEASPSGSTRPVMVAGMTAIVVLLLVAVGIGIALLVRNSSSNSNTANAEDKSRAANINSNGNASNVVNDNGGNSSNGSSNRSVANVNANRNDSNRNDSAKTGAALRAEKKVVDGAPLTDADLASLSQDELSLLRNAISARYGRTFKNVALQRYFTARPWYKPRPSLTDEEVEAALSPQDKANRALIMEYEKKYGNSQ
ncbi:MAG: YARHG domain-containing protein [Pyrinomonadaceae bacterium]|nr:YARHG domain-containing protein [Pyrinomonadaceae bacterium]